MTPPIGVKKSLSPSVVLLCVFFFTVLCVTVANVSMVKHSDYKWNFLVSVMFAILSNAIVLRHWVALGKLKILAAGLGILSAVQALYALVQIGRM